MPSKCVSWLGWHTTQLNRVFDRYGSERRAFTDLIIFIGKQGFNVFDEAFWQIEQ
jgi:hypothetical protein